MVDGLEHLLPRTSRGAISPSDRLEIEQDRRDRRENRFVVDLLKSLIADRKEVVRMVDDEVGGKANFDWFNRLDHLPMSFGWSEVRHYDPQKLFSSPTKTEAYLRFAELRSEAARSLGRRWNGAFVMVISPIGQTGNYQAIHDCHALLGEAKAFLTFIVRGVYHYVQPWSDVLEVVRGRYGRSSG